MRFTEFLVEAPPAVQQKPRGRMVNGKFVPAQQPQRKPQPARGQGGRFTPKPALDPMNPRPQQSVDFQHNSNVEPVQPGNKGKPKPITGDTVEFKPDKNVEPVQPKNNTPWEKMKRLAGTDNAAGREFITLLGAMYQAKRRNPAVQMTVPKMITNMPVDDDKQKAIKQQMVQLFNMAKDKGLPELAALSKELQTARQDVMKQAGEQGKIQPAQPKTAQSPQGSGDSQLAAAVEKEGTKSTRKGLQGAIDRLRQLLKNKPEPELPQPGNQKKPGIISTG